MHHWCDPERLRLQSRMHIHDVKSYHSVQSYKLKRGSGVDTLSMGTISTGRLWADDGGLTHLVAILILDLASPGQGRATYNTYAKLVVRNLFQQLSEVYSSNR